MAIEGRHRHALDKERELTEGKRSLADFATGYLYFGLQKLKKGWAFREWAPSAVSIFMIGDFNGWREEEKFRLDKIERDQGIWELYLEESDIKHGDLLMCCGTDAVLAWVSMSRK